MFCFCFFLSSNKVLSMENVIILGYSVGWWNGVKNNFDEKFVTTKSNFDISRCLFRKLLNLLFTIQHCSSFAQIFFLFNDVTFMFIFQYQYLTMSNFFIECFEHFYFILYYLQVFSKLDYWGSTSINFGNLSIIYKKYDFIIYTIL